MANLMGCTTVARCTKCGREFVAFPKDGDMIDPYIPQGTRTNDIPTTSPCRGKVVMVVPDEALVKM